MTNEQAKQDAINKIVSYYYDDYPLIKPFVQDNGFIEIKDGYRSNLDFNVKKFYNSFEKVFIAAKDHEEYYSHFMPKELKVLIDEVENNNGWTRIEPDGSNLPKDSSKMYKSVINGEINDNNLNTGWIRSGWEVGEITHYKPITPEKPPIY